MRKLAAGLAIGVAAGALALAIGHTPPFVTAEAKLYDMRMRRAAGSGAPRADIALVEINETSLRDLEPLLGRWPWPRLTHAMLIDFIAKGQPKAIAYDVLFTEPDSRLTFEFGDLVLSGADSDAALADAVRSAGNVVLLVEAVYEGVTGTLARSSTIPDSGYPYDEAAPERPVVTPPIAALAAGARALGHNWLVLDDDGVARRVSPLIRAGGKMMPSLGLAAALAASGRDTSQTRFPPDRLIRYEAPPLDAGGTRPYPSYDARQILLAGEELAAGEAPSVDPSVFRDKVVFVGVTAEGIGDVFTSPFEAAGKMPGIFMHASLADNILSSRTLARAPRWMNVLVLFVPVLVIAIASARLPLFAGTALSLLVMIALTVLSFALFARGHWSFLAGPLLGSALALFGGVAYQYFFEGREKRRVKQLFGRYVSPDVFERLLDDPSLAALGGERREMSVLFSDIRGFTSVSETGNPEAIVAQLNEYFGRMVEVVFRNGGTVDKFVGDMVMALFGAPVADARHADHAVAAALDMVRELEDLNVTWKAEGRPALGIGIGVNSGEMIAGNIGSARIMSYTVIGDAVNLGARLESLNKDYGTRIIISAATRERLTAPVDFTPLGEVVVKGRSAPVHIWGRV
ncbi:MAG: adenylate/guanylate cyclase domain-containing protein [Acidobacteriota bacterium]|nr:adenylate/guanylate cyclase domain-containing protein [Acidobacteriota bacterium]